MSLLAKYADSLNKAVDNIESFRAKILDVFVIKVAEDNTWRKIGIKTDKGTFFGFENALHGMSVGQFIPEKGLDAQISVRENTYKDGEEDKASLQVIKCSVDLVSYRAEQIKGTGVVVNLF